jgi:hypothetical protein
MVWDVKPAWFYSMRFQSDQLFEPTIEPLQKLHDAAVEVTDALVKLQAEATEATWKYLVDQEALDKLVPALSALVSFYAATDILRRLPSRRVKIEPSRGRPESKIDPFIATVYADSVKRALIDAGGSTNISLTSTTGPVARIGSKLMGLRKNRTIPPHTFADWVRRGQGLRPPYWEY